MLSVRYLVKRGVYLALVSLALFPGQGCNTLAPVLPEGTSMAEPALEDPNQAAADATLSSQSIDMTAATSQVPCTFEWLSPISDKSVRAFTKWDPDGPGPQPPLLVAGGHFDFFLDGGWQDSHVAVWDGISWQPLQPGPIDHHESLSVAALTVFQGELIAGGRFENLDGTATSNIARWDGTNWQPMGSGLNSIVLALSVYQDKLIAAGYFDHAGDTSVNHIAQWDGARWVPLGTGVSGSFAGEWSFTHVSALSVYEGNLIAGGNFTIAGGVTANGIAQWDGVSWQPLSSGTDERVLALTVYNQPELEKSWLIAGGLFTSAGGTIADQIARWNGTYWEAIGGLGVTELTVISRLAVYNNDLIVGGVFLIAGGTDDGIPDTIAQCQFTDVGFIWDRLGDGLYGIPSAMTAYHGDLVVAKHEDRGSDGINRWGPTNPSPPNISRQPKSSNTRVGTAVSFSVTATGCPAPAYQWRKDGVPLEESAHLHGSQSANLVIDVANWADVGLYDCVLNNGVGELASNSARLRVR